MCEELLLKEFNSKFVKCFEKSETQFYSDFNHNLFDFMSIYFNNEKFEYLNIEQEIDQSIKEFHKILNELVISTIYYNKGQYKGDVIATSLLSSINSQLDSQNSQFDSQNSNSTLNSQFEDSEDSEDESLIIDSHIPHGFGSWRFVEENNEIFYKGEWKRGKKEGFGILQTFEILYEGEWKNNEMNGFGIFKILNGYHKGSIYYGNFKKGKRNGFGIQFYKYQGNDEILRDDIGNEFNEWYRGEWLNDIRNGKGEFKSKYEWKLGEWKKHEFVNGISLIKECLEIQDSVVTNCIHSCIEYEKYSKKAKKSQIPSTILPFIFSLDNLDKLTIVDAIIAYGNQSKSPKRTVYNGYCFRSKLESRWAKFFEFCGIEYQYECKTFILKDGTSYTPDFYLPFLNYWIEIKPNYPSEEERVKAQLLTFVLQKNNQQKELTEFEKKHERYLQSNPRVFILYGDVSAPFIKKFQTGGMAIEFFKTDQQESTIIQNRTNKRITPPRGSSTSNPIRESVLFSTTEPLGWCQCHHCGKTSLEYRCQPKCCVNRTSSDSTTLCTRVDSVVTSELGPILSRAYFEVSKLSFDEWRVRNETTFFNSITPEIDLSTTEKKRSKFF